MEKSSKNKKNKIIYIVIIISVLIIAVIAWNQFQEDMFFQPWNDLNSYEKLQKLDEFEEIKIKNDEVNISGWFWNIQNKKEPSPLIIFFTGNCQNSSNTMYNYYVTEGMKEVFGDYNLMIVDYPGYGMSKGTPSDKSMFKASDNIFNYAVQMNKVDSNNIVIMGYSIGTGVASYCASNNDSNALILISPYDKAISLYNDFVDIFHGWIQSFARYKFDSETFAENVDEPTLIFTSKADEVINYRHSLDLSVHFSNLEEVIILEDVDHNSYFSQEKVLNNIKEFLRKTIK